MTDAQINQPPIQHSAKVIRTWPPQDGEENNSSISLTPQKAALGYAMLRDDPDALNAYKYDSKGSRLLQRKLDEAGMGALVETFRRYPKDCLGMARQALYRIRQDTDKAATPKKKAERTARYLDAYFELMLELDHSAFPPQSDLTEVKSGVPDYIPDGYLDMGGENQLDPTKRHGREMLLVDKRKIFQQARDLMLDFFRYQPGPGMNNDEFLDGIKKFIVEKVGYFVNTSMKANSGGKSHEGTVADLSDYMNQGNFETVCRHHALYAQVLLQAMGITSRLVKSDFGHVGETLERHANNIIRVNGKWFLLDITNPETIDGKGQVYMKGIPEKAVDLSGQTYTWQIPDNGKPDRVYKSRQDAYYQVRPII